MTLIRWDCNERKLFKIMKDTLNVIEYLRIAGSLSKIRISLSVTATTFTGYYVYSGSLSPLLPPLLGGIFLLAAGSSALNHIQERDTDAMMDRTKGRPLPSQLVSSRQVMVFAVAALIGGTAVLASNFIFAVPMLGLSNLIWYNGVYTPLKKVTAFAVIPGSVTGGIPPLIGWVAAGGGFADTDIMVIVLFFIIGQIPHFWLLLLKYGKEYENAGLPSITSLFSKIQINHISYAWIVAAVASSALLPARGLITGIPLMTAYILAAAFLIIVSVLHNLNSTENRQWITFTALNLFYLLMMLLLVLEKII